MQVDAAIEVKSINIRTECGKPSFLFLFSIFYRFSSRNNYTNLEIHQQSVLLFIFIT